jgi:hypothetical protein
MESLAILVAIILGIAVFSGPIALFLTWLPVINREETNDGIALIRRIFVTLLTVLGSLVSFMLFIANAGIGASLMAIFGSVTAFFAVKREYFPDGLRSGKPKGNGFGRRGDRRNGPDGQH